MIVGESIVSLQGLVAMLVTLALHAAAARRRAQVTSVAVYPPDISLNTKADRSGSSSWPRATTA